MRGADLPADPAADRRPHPHPGGGRAVPGARTGRPRPQGRVRRPLPPAPDPGLLARPDQRRHARPRRPAQARQAEEAHDRGGRRPSRGEGLLEAPAHRLGRDRARSRRRAGGLRLRRPAREGPGPRAALLREDGLPQRAPHRHRRPRAALVLVQLAVRRVPGVPRPRHPDGGRPRAGRLRPEPDARRGRDPAVVGGARLRLLPPAALRPRRRARLRPQHPLGAAARQGPLLDPRRPRDQGARPAHQPLRPRALLLHRLRGRPPLHRAPARRGRDRHQPRAVRGLHARGPVPGVPGQPAQAGVDGRDPRRTQHRRRLRDADQRDRRLPAHPRAVHPREADRRAGAQGDPGAAQLPARRGPGLPLPRPALGVAVRRRGAADPARDPDRRGPGRRPLRPRRAVDRPAPARQPPAHRHPGAAEEPRQHADRGRARRGHDPGRRLGGRHRPGRRRARRPGGRLRPGPGAAGPPRLVDRHVPLGAALDPGPGGATPPHARARAGGARGQGAQPPGHRRRLPARRLRRGHRRLGVRASPPWSTTSSTPRWPSRSTTPARSRDGTAASRGSTTSTR